MTRAGEPRWPPAAAVLAFIAFSVGLCLVLPSEGSLGPAWLIALRLIAGGGDTNSPGPLLAAGALVLTGNNLAFGLFCTGASTGAGRRPVPEDCRPTPTSPSPSS